MPDVREQILAEVDRYEHLIADGRHPLAEALRAVMGRHEPDALWVLEVEDRETCVRETVREDAEEFTGQPDEVFCGCAPRQFYADPCPTVQAITAALGIEVNLYG